MVDDRPPGEGQIQEDLYVCTKCARTRRSSVPVAFCNCGEKMVQAKR